MKLKFMSVKEFGALYFFGLFIYFSNEKCNTVIVSQ